MTPPITPELYEVRLAIGRRLRRARERARLSQSDAAQRAGIKKIKWLRFEQGVHPIPSELLGTLARAANTNVTKLLPRAA